MLLDVFDLVLDCLSGWGKTASLRSLSVSSGPRRVGLVRIFRERRNVGGGDLLSYFPLIQEMWPPFGLRG
jgi:hypothetical protein